MNYNKLILIGSLLAIVGCNKNSSTSSTEAMSCTKTEVSTCFDYGTGYTSDTAQQSCTAISGTYATSSCTTTNRVGRCAVTSSGVTITTSYYSPTFAADTAQSSCTSQSGTFTAE